MMLKEGHVLVYVKSLPDENDEQDLLVYFMWRSGRLTNEQIGQLVGLS